MTAGPDDAGRRLDKVLRAALPSESLSAIYSGLRKGQIKVNGLKAGPGLKLKEGDRISLRLPSRGGAGTMPATEESRADRAAPAPALDDLGSIEDILILATEHLLFLNKPRGELSQGSEGLEGRVREALAARMAASLSFVPGPLHRLDRNSSGVLAFPRSAEGARAFTSLLRERRIEKLYLALVEGEVAEEGAWRDRIARDGASLKSAVDEGGDEAAADMRPLLRGRGLSLVLVTLHSGLTHQIRVQASARGMPLAGDSKYGASPFAGGYILHALSLGFPEAPFPDIPTRVAAPLPKPAIRRLESVFGAEALASALADALGPR
jgi:23S rRNA pseudouridine955/2504/2580 synthase